MQKRINDDGTVSLWIESKVLSISDNVRELDNDKHTKFRNAKVEFANAQGEVVQRTSKIWESNVDKINVGDEVYTVAEKGEDDKIYLTTTPLTGYADEEDFDADAFEVPAATQA